MTRRKWYTHDFLAESQKLLERAPISNAGRAPPRDRLSNISKYSSCLLDIACYDDNPRNEGLVGVNVNKTLHMAPVEEV
ncbi:uncharacterized protein TNCV_3165841 [Trichonephila clavipes]|uniref:Uncharacterized protein n=1 Tax=Trichonephila clavipes TaxID=2585209 RepID=A0A8X6V0Y6_TRICX|nr:uncharacterized protein TNCV_3165841 [Trichonephila clavipes]